MPTLNEAAEVLRLRKHLSTVLGILPQDFRGSTFWEDDEGYFVEHQWHKEARAAIAADPGPLVSAVEQMATVLSERHAETCQSILLDCDCKLGHRQRAALDAYHAALGGNDGTR